MSDQELAQHIHLIEDNLLTCGLNSNYSDRMFPVYHAALAEARKRNLHV